MYTGSLPNLRAEHSFGRILYPTSLLPWRLIYDFQPHGPVSKLAYMELQLDDFRRESKQRPTSQPFRSAYPVY